MHPTRVNVVRSLMALTSVLTLVILSALAMRMDAIATRMVGSPAGYDPLSAQEVAAALGVVLQAGGEDGVRATESGAAEVLLVERHDAAKTAYATGAWPRRGDVYVYEYATDTLVYSTVDLESGAVIATERVQGVQLPLTTHEKARALALVQADAPLWGSLTARYQAITGQLLTHIDQLQVKVSVFHADVMPGRLNPDAEQCGQHRCAQVLLFTVDKTLLELTPIVDLSQGRVVQIMGEE
ncbi:MAG: hypothetical protein KJZ93_28265 [Caldilineaceae bacterium]|nr:hypothetical protein [Caldilineaceae bacterium]